MKYIVIAKISNIISYKVCTNEVSSFGSWGKTKWITNTGPPVNKQMQYVYWQQLNWMFGSCGWQIV